MISALLQGVITLIIDLVSLILVPFDLIITALLPDVANFLAVVGQFFNTLTQSMGWVVSSLGISQVFIDTIVVYFVFKLTAPLSVHAVKLAIKWYKALKP